MLALVVIPAVSRRRRLFAIGAVLALLVGIGAAFAWRTALRIVRERIVLALGPGAEIEALDVGLAAVEIRRLTVPGGEGWPVEQALRAERVRVVPALRTALSDTIVVHSITIEKPYVSAVRTRDGRLVVLPTVLGKHGADTGEPSTSPTPVTAPGSQPVAKRSVRIEKLSIDDGDVELFDQSIARAPWRLHLSDVRASVRDIEAPDISSRMPFEISGSLDGPQRDGTVAVSGWFEGSTEDLKADAKFQDLDLLALEPYIARGAHVSLSGGTCNLSFNATVHSHRMHAPGHLELVDLAFKPGGTSTDLVLGVPRNVLVKAMASHNGRIALDFTLEGDVSDPHFSLNEELSTRLAVAMANALGLTVGGLVKDVGEIGAEGLGGAGKAAKGVGEKLKGLFHDH